VKPLAVGLNAAIFAVTDDEPRVLTVEDPRAIAPGALPGEPALPFGQLDPEGDRTLELGLRGWVREQTGLELGYVEQLYTFGDRDRHLGGDDHARVLSIAYLALVREHDEPSVEAHWRDVYELLPWEDWRRGRPSLHTRVLSPRLRQWAAAAPPALRRQRRERVEIAFGQAGARWDEERVLDRYELLYEAGLLPEARRDAAGAKAAMGAKGAATTKGGGAAGDASAARGAGAARAQPAESGLGRSMVLDHRRIVATALGRLRGKLKYRPVVFELLPPYFTLLQLQRLVEALAGTRLHKQNFRRLVEKAGLVEGTGKVETRTGGRPAELFAFRREVLRERPAPGVGLPGLRA
jgi:hypothetical protein